MLDIEGNFEIPKNISQLTAFIEESIKSENENATFNSVEINSYDEDIIISIKKDKSVLYSNTVLNFYKTETPITFTSTLIDDKVYMVSNEKLNIDDLVHHVHVYSCTALKVKLCSSVETSLCGAPVDTNAYLEIPMVFNAPKLIKNTAGKSAIIGENRFIDGSTDGVLLSDSRVSRNNTNKIAEVLAINISGVGKIKYTRKDVYCLCRFSISRQGKVVIIIESTLPDRFEFKLKDAFLEVSKFDGYVPMKDISKQKEGEIKK